MNVWTLGDAVVDLLPLEGMTYEACVGGAPVNVAAGIARLGQRSGFIGRIGNDTFGQYLKTEIHRLGVNTDFIEVDSQRNTSTVLVSSDKNGDRSFDFLVKSSADQYLTEDAVPQFDNDILHLCSLSLVSEISRTTVKYAIDRVKENNGLLSFDLNIREQMWSNKEDMFYIVNQVAEQADVLKLSEEELYFLTRTDDPVVSRERLSAYPAELKVVTYGELGSIIFWRSSVFCFSGFDVQVIDTTGAGDAYIAGLLTNIAEYGMPSSSAQLMRYAKEASACGALATTQKGALAAMPDRETLNRFLDNQN